MATTIGTLPIFIRVGSGKEIRVGDIEVEVVNGRVKVPSWTQLRRAIKKAL